MWHILMLSAIDIFFWKGLSEKAFISESQPNYNRIE